MSPDILTAYLGVLLAALWTPGPNNAMLASSGASFGFRATLQHLFGVSLGFGFLMFCTALGLAQAFEIFPPLQTVLRWGAPALLLWVAYRIARSGGSRAGVSRKPFNFWQAAAFQWINPKAWVMAVGFAGQFGVGMSPLQAGIWLGAIAALAGTSSAAGWAAVGAALQRWLGEGIHLRLFNLAMAGIICLGVFYLLLDAGA